MTKTIIRRVRLDLPHDLAPPYAAMLAKLPYHQWLKAHAVEVAGLSDDAGNALLADVLPRMGNTASGTVFVTDFEFGSDARFQYYNTHFLAKMRGRIEESYPGATAAGSPFAYRIATHEQPAFASLLDGIENLKAI